MSHKCPTLPDLDCGKQLAAGMIGKMFQIILLLVVLLIPFDLHAKSPSSVCQNWFAASKTPKGQNCLSRCVSLGVDMGTFSCHLECAALCKTSPSAGGVLAKELADRYPGLTPSEREMVGNYPSESVKAYRLSWDAESQCKTLYRTSDTNDESDACRHFVWAGLLAESMGSELAKKFLDAHEQEPNQPEQEKAMDLANNRAGLLVAKQMLREKRFSKPALLESFQEELNSNRLIVIKQKRRQPKGPKP
jgi:hypothetical protein